MFSPLFFKILLFILPLAAIALTEQDWKAMARSVGVIFANDLGRNGHYDQKSIYETKAVIF